MIVVDTNVLAYFLLPYEFSAAADALFKRDPDWAAPILWRSEFRNLLAGELRRKNLSFEEVVKVQGEAEALLAGHEYEGVRRLCGSSLCGGTCGLAFVWIQ